MKCAAHPNVETNLSCGKCGRPICPKCMVQTPVGARCSACARMYKLPTFRVSTGYYLRAIGVALGMSIACGLVWGLVSSFIPFFYLNILLAFGAGYAIGEVISISVNRKRSKGLAAIAGTALVISYVIAVFSFGRLPSSIFSIVFDLVALVLGVLFTVNRLR